MSGHVEVEVFLTADGDIATGANVGDIPCMVFFGIGAIGVVMVGEDLHGTGGNREGNSTVVAGKPHATIDQLGFEGILLGNLADLIRVAKITPSFVYRDFIAVRVTFEHGYLTSGQVVGVLLPVLAVDDESWTVFRVGVDRVLADMGLVVDMRWFSQPLSREGGDGAVGIARGFSAYTGQVVSQALCLLGRGMKVARVSDDGQGGRRGNHRSEEHTS